MISKDKELISILKTLPNTQKRIEYIERFGSDKLPPWFPGDTQKDQENLCAKCLEADKSWWDLNKKLGEQLKAGKIII